MPEQFENPVAKSSKESKSKPLTPIYDCSLSWLCTGISIKIGGVKLVLWDQISSLS